MGLVRGVNFYLPVLLLLAVSGAAFAADYQNISACASLSAENTTYTLTGDVSSAGTCFAFVAANVTLDCNGHSITAGAAIYSDQAYTKVRDCSITSANGSGIYFNGVASGEISGTNATSTGNGEGIHFSGASYNMVTDTRGASASPGNSFGIQLTFSSNYNNFTNVVATSEYRDALYVMQSSSHNLFINTTGSFISPTNPGYTGIRIEAPGNTLINSTATSTSAAGLYMSTANSSTFANGLVSGNSSVYGAILIAYGSQDITIANSTVEGGTGRGITIQQLGGTSDNLKITNTSVVSALDGIRNAYGANMTVDCQGKTMAGANTTGSSGVYSTQNSTTVKNCHINNFQTGVHYNGTGTGISYGDVSNITVNSTSSAYCTGAGGIFFEYVSHASITNATISTPCRIAYLGSVYELSATGIYGGMDGALTLNVCYDSNVTHVTAGAMLLQAAYGNVIDDVRSIGQLYMPISSNNVIRNSTFTDTMLLGGSTNNTFYWNNFTAASGSYINDAVGGNFYNATIAGNGEGNIYANVLSGAVQVNGSAPSAGFSSLYIGTGGAVPYNASDSAGGMVGFAIDYAPLTANSNNSTSPQLGNLTVECGIFQAWGSTTIPPNPCSTVNTTGSAYNFTVPSTLPISASWGDPNLTFMNWDSIGNPNCTYANSSSPATSITVAGGTCRAVTNFWYGPMPQPCACGVLSTPNYVCNVTTDLASNGTCFTVNATNVTIQCNGHSITGNGSAWSYGVYSNQPSTSVLNCNINEFAMGARLASNGAVMTGNNITTSAVYGGFGGTMGIFLEGTSNGIFSRNTINVSGNSSTWDAAMRLEGNSTGNAISDSVLEGGSLALVVLENSSYNTFTNISAKGAAGAIVIGPYNVTSNGYSYLGYSDNLVFTGLSVPGTAGTALKNQGSNNLLVDCTGGSLAGSDASGTYGIYTSQFNTTVKNCQISGFQHGVFFDAATNGTIQNVTAGSTQYPGTGVFLGTGSSYNTVSDSTLTSAISNALQLHFAEHNTITNTTGSAGVGSGMYVFGSAYTTIRGSTGASSNGTGMVLYNTANSVLSSSQISGNSGFYGALSLRGSSHGNTVANSTINGMAGAQAVTFRSEGSNSASSNTFVNNTLMNATSLALLDADAGSNLFYWNNFTATSGLLVNDSNGGNFYNTTLFGQGEGNLWADVLDGTVNVNGTAFSAYGPGFYLGATGSGYPYSNATSAKVIGAAVDSAPLILGPIIIANVIVTGSAGGSVSGTAYNVTVPATLPISATANSGYTFSGWSRTGNCTINSTASGSTTVYVFGAVCNINAAFTYNGGGGGGGGGSGGSGGGSTGGGGGGSPSSSEAYQTFPVEICSNVVCNITVTRSIASTNASSVMTTTIENLGGSACNLEDFIYSDTLPSNFADVGELSFSTPYTLRYGQNIVFMFTTFAAGESKTLTYTAPRWVPPSRIQSFGPPTLNAKRCAAVQAVNGTNETKPPLTPVPVSQAPGLDIKPPTSAQPAASPAAAASLFSIDFARLAGQYAWMLCPIGILVALLLLALFLRRKCKNKKCEAMNWPWASKCTKCGREL